MTWALEYTLLKWCCLLGPFYPPAATFTQLRLAASETVWNFYVYVHACALWWCYSTVIIAYLVCIVCMLTVFASTLLPLHGVKAFSQLWRTPSCWWGKSITQYHTIWSIDLNLFLTKYLFTGSLIFLPVKTFTSYDAFRSTVDYKDFMLRFEDYAMFDFHGWWPLP